ncbi:claudin domain-containing protein 1b [Tachysurus fulvidraco]|uniref:claudin domain-containing protein 1b n=1 Tax=Tachysurus fulvidraco TaxID=1234273 RepID=UPI001FEF2569|nr:claudin domain-containing protein 1b [Tachysurus fulvidraco]XP_047671914.1 claudin domain-containing protein 1b [Tachysurus fulvidraco]
MVDNRYATALVIGSVLSLLASVYLSVAVGTQHWYQYRSPPTSNDANNGSDLQKLKEDFMGEDVMEVQYSTALFRINGSLGLWWRCILWSQPDSKVVSECKAFTLAQQFEVKYKHPNNSSSVEDFLRTALWRCRFVFPLVSLGLVFLAALVGVCACLCRSLTPTLFVGLLHLLAGLCSLATVCCFLAGVDLLHQVLEWPEGVDSSLGWSLYLALVSSPLQMMAAALFMWAARSHRKNYTRMTAYRVA